MAAYRIAQEALTNIAKHAKASAAVIDVTSNGAKIAIFDDGGGMTASGETRSTALGMTSMRHRAETLGGRLDVITGSTGTTVTAVLPLNPP